MGTSPDDIMVQVAGNKAGPSNGGEAVSHLDAAMAELDMEHYDDSDVEGNSSVPGLFSDSKHPGMQDPLLIVGSELSCKQMAISLAATMKAELDVLQKRGLHGWLLPLKCFSQHTVGRMGRHGVLQQARGRPIHHCA